MSGVTLPSRRQPAEQASLWEWSEHHNNHILGLAISPRTANGTRGVYTVVASTAGLAQTASFTLSNTATAPALITAIGGTPQSAPLFTRFGAPLVARVTDASGNPVSGAIVQFFGAQSSSDAFFGTFSNGLNQDDELVDANGVATSKTYTASGVAGSYTSRRSAEIYNYGGSGDTASGPLSR